jgi:toxin ParE1/3/4
MVRRFRTVAELDLDDDLGLLGQKPGAGQAERYIRLIQDTIIGLVQGTQPSRSASHVRAGYRSVLVGAHVVFLHATSRTSLPS